MLLLCQAADFLVPGDDLLLGLGYLSPTAICARVLGGSPATAPSGRKQLLSSFQFSVARHSASMVATGCCLLKCIKQMKEEMP